MQQQDVSITDANDDTARSKMAPHSAMLDLIGDLKKKKKKEKDEAKRSDAEKEKKKKKEPKKKFKTVRKEDRFAPKNYLFRIDGSICCSGIIVTMLMVITNVLVLLWVITISKGDIKYLINRTPFDVEN